jgi:tripartite-type tricarboxylate transporter receptor subunit TctC
MRFRIFFLALLCAASLPVAAQTYPDRPVRIIVPFPPGGGTDIIARLVARRLTDAFGQSVVVENRPGAGGTVGADAAAKAPPNGYTLLVVSASYAVNPSLYKMPFDPLADLVPVSLIASVPFVLVSPPGFSANSVNQLVTLARTTPGGINFASSGNGSAPHLVGELFAMQTGTKLVHVPFKGGAPALTEVMGGRVEMYFSTISLAQASLTAGKLKALAVTSKQRSSLLPRVPTLEESGVAGIDLVDWFGLLAPRGTPPAIVNRLSEEIARQVQGAEMKAQLATDGFEAIGGSPAQFESVLRRDIGDYARIVKAVGVRID